MAKHKQIKTKYVYIKPKNVEEKNKQQEVIDNVFTILFDEVVKKNDKA